MISSVSCVAVHTIAGQVAVGIVGQYVRAITDKLVGGVVDLVGDRRLPHANTF